MRGLVRHAALSVIATLPQIARRSVADIVARVVAQQAGRTDQPAGMRRIGIDDIPHRRGQRHLTVTRAVNAGPGAGRGQQRRRSGSYRVTR